MERYLMTIALAVLFPVMIFCQEKVSPRADKVKIEAIHNNNSIIGSDSTAEAELNQLSKTWTDAIMRHDSLALVNLMAEEYTLRNWNGSSMHITKRAAWLDNLFHRLRITRFEQTAISAQVYGNVATVTSFYDWAGVFGTSPFDSKGYLTDIWIHRNNKWQVISRTAGIFPGSNSLNGK